MTNEIYQLLESLVRLLSDEECDKLIAFVDQLSQEEKEVAK